MIKKGSKVIYKGPNTKYKGGKAIVISKTYNDGETGYWSKNIDIKFEELRVPYNAKIENLELDIQSIREDRLNNLLD